MRPLVARDMEYIAEAARGDHADVGALALDHHVGGNRRAVQHHVDAAWRDARDPANVHDALHDAHGLIRRRRGNFMHEDALTRSGGRVFQDDIGKGAAHIDADTDHVWFPCVVTRL